MTKAAIADPGLEAAIRAAGSISELARRLGISQPSISNWSRIPTDRVAAVEAATGIGRIVLRPDLYVAAPSDEIERARAREYALLSTLLNRSPDAGMLERLASLRGDDTPLGRAHAALAEAAQAANAAEVEREYFALFVGVGRGELLPYGSYYLTGFLHERPLARLRADLQVMNILPDCQPSEPEDHAATLCTVMSGLIDGACAVPVTAQRQFFDKHLAPWLGRFWTDLEKAEHAQLYRAVGTVGRVFIDIETEAFALAA